MKETSRYGLVLQDGDISSVTVSKIGRMLPKATIIVMGYEGMCEPYGEIHLDSKRPKLFTYSTPISAGRKSIHVNLELDRLTRQIIFRATYDRYDWDYALCYDDYALCYDDNRQLEYLVAERFRYDCEHLHPNVTAVEFSASIAGPAMNLDLEDISRALRARQTKGQRLIRCIRIAGCRPYTPKQIQEFLVEHGRNLDVFVIKAKKFGVLRYTNCSAF